MVGAVGAWQLNLFGHAGVQFVMSSLHPQKFCENGHGTGDVMDACHGYTQRLTFVNVIHESHQLQLLGRISRHPEPSRSTVAPKHQKKRPLSLYDLLGIGL